MLNIETSFSVPGLKCPEEMNAKLGFNFETGSRKVICDSNDILGSNTLDIFCDIYGTSWYFLFKDLNPLEEDETYDFGFGSSLTFAMEKERITIRYIDRDHIDVTVNDNDTYHCDIHGNFYPDESNADISVNVKLCLMSKVKNLYIYLRKRFVFIFDDGYEKDIGSIGNHYIYEKVHNVFVETPNKHCLANVALESARYADVLCLSMFGKENLVHFLEDIDNGYSKAHNTIEIINFEKAEKPKLDIGDIKDIIKDIEQNGPKMRTFTLSPHQMSDELKDAMDKAMTSFEGEGFGLRGLKYNPQTGEFEPLEKEDLQAAVESGQVSRMLEDFKNRVEEDKKNGTLDTELSDDLDAILEKVIDDIQEGKVEGVEYDKETDSFFSTKPPREKPNNIDELFDMFLEDVIAGKVKGITYDSENELFINGDGMIANKKQMKRILKRSYNMYEIGPDGYPIIDDEEDDDDE